MIANESIQINLLTPTMDPIQSSTDRSTMDRRLHLWIQSIRVDWIKLGSRHSVSFESGTYSGREVASEETDTENVQIGNGEAEYNRSITCIETAVELEAKAAQSQEGSEKEEETEERRGSRRAECTQ
jgi:hypothetical protein